MTLAILAAVAGVHLAATSRERDVSTRPKAPPPRSIAAPTLAELHTAEMARIMRQNAAIFAEVPSAFWCDPNLYGDGPRDEYGDAPRPVIHGRHRTEGQFTDHYATFREHGILVPQKTVRIVGSPAYYSDVPPPNPAPECPNCTYGSASVTADHGGEPSMWLCALCNTEYTRAGETKSSRKRRLANPDDYDTDMPRPPRMT